MERQAGYREGDQPQEVNGRRARELEEYEGDAEEKKEQYTERGV